MFHFPNLLRSIILLPLLLSLSIYAQIPQRWEIDAKTFRANSDQVETGDMDSDGDLDIVVGGGNYYYMMWFENTGTTFLTQQHVLNIVADRFILSDINGDSYLDIVSSHSWNIEINYNLNISGTGLDFEEHTIYAPLTGAYSFPFTVADLDSDNDDDILYTTTGAHELIWAENVYAEGGEFIPHGIFELTYYPNQYAVGDFDNDDDMDIITSTLDDNVCWIENLGGEFFSFETIIEEIENMECMTFADLQGDNDLDLLIGAGKSYIDDDNGLFVLYNDGLGNFSDAVNYYTYTDVINITTGFINDDIYPDVVFLDNILGALDGYPVNGHMLYGTEDATLSDINNLLSFTPPQFDLTGFSKGDLSDINEDGFDDLAISVNGGVIWSTNVPAEGHFSGYKQLAQMRAEPRGLSFIDENGSDENEIILYDRNGRINSYVFDTIANDFELISKPDSVAKLFNVSSLLTFDFDNDGLEDIFANSYSACVDCLYDDEYKILWVYKNLPGQGVYASPSIAATEKLIYPITSDIDGDGYKDIVASYPNYYFAGYDDDGFEIYASQYNIYWLKNESGSGIFTKHMISLEDTPTQNITKSGDMDEDGDMDVISVNYATGNLGWWENLDGLGSFSDIQDLIEIDSIRAFDIIDEDNDGDTDILLFLNNALFISLNETGVFTDTLLRSSITDGYYAGTPLVEDIDSDGRQDVISGSFQTYYHHNTALTGIDSIPAVMPFNYNYTIAADINDDGFAEIAGVPDEDYFPGDSAFAIEINPEPVYVVVEHSNDSLTLDENLFYTDTITVHLNTIPAETCYMKFNAKAEFDPEYELTIAGADPHVFTMIFNPDSTALIPQTIVITAENDYEMDSADRGKLFTEAYSDHNIYDFLFDGVTYFDILDNDYEEVSNQDNNQALHILPYYDESQQNLYITYNALSTSNTINLYTIDGKIITGINTNQSSGTVSINCSGFAEGLYLIEFIDKKNNLRAIRKVVF